MNEVDRLVAEANKDPTNMSILRFGDNHESIKEGVGSIDVPSSNYSMSKGSLPRSNPYTSVEDVAKIEGSYEKFKSLLGN